MMSGPTGPVARSAGRSSSSRSLMSSGPKPKRSGVVMSADPEDTLEDRMQRAIVAAFEAEAEPWRLSDDSGDRLARIAARAAARVARGRRRA